MLSALLLIPMIGALIVGFVPGLPSASKLRQITTIFVFISLALSIYLLTQFDLTNSGFQFREYLTWAQPIGLNYSLGIDGLSLPLLVLNSLLCCIAIYSIGETLERSRLYYALILLINGGIAGASFSRNRHPTRWNLS